MDDWPAPRWGHPLPPPSKYLRMRALQWLSLLAVMAFLVGTIVYRNAQKTIADENLLILPEEVVLPFSSEYLPQADYYAESLGEDPRLISLSFQRSPSSSSKHTYHPQLVFCYPKVPEQLIAMDIEIHRAILRKDRFQAKRLPPGALATLDCAADSLHPPRLSAPEALLTAQAYLAAKYPSAPEVWPDHLALQKDPQQGYLWEILYQNFRNATDLVIRVDSGTRVLQILEQP